MARRRQPIDEQESCDLQSRLPQLLGPEVSLSYHDLPVLPTLSPFLSTPPFIYFYSIHGLKKRHEDMANLEPCLFA